MTVTENKKPATPPAGFKALEPSSFIVSMAEGGDKLTFGGIDYIFDPASKYKYPRVVVASAGLRTVRCMANHGKQTRRLKAST